MDLSIFSETVQAGLSNVNLDKLYEIRMRKDYPIKLNVGGQACYLSLKGATLNYDCALKVKSENISKIIENITENSVYAFNEQIKMGFLITKEGVRVGIAGECVFDNGKVLTIKNFSSLNFRIPHLIKDASKNVLNYVIDEDLSVRNSLIIGPPFCGKTTILKDLCLQINNKTINSILLIDERGEFYCIDGINIDKIVFSDKLFAFEYGIRSLSPNVIITDEIASQSDWNYLCNAKNSGVSVVASIHAKDLEEVKQKQYFKKDIFERYFVFSKKNGFGCLEGVYDKDFNLI